MPRANRYIVSGPAYYLTHRCHDRTFLLRFAKDRDAYREMLRQQLAARPEVRLLTYCITCNHVHLLLASHATDAAVSGLMQALEGEFAGYYNRRKGRSGAFWGGRFHATMIDSGAYLWRCMRYIEMNMVRAGVVRHPAEWAWTGFREIAGLRRRYRLVDLAELLERTDQTDARRLQAWYTEWIAEAVAAEADRRDARWTECIAVGGRTFVEQLARGVESRMKVELCQDGTGGWMVREAGTAYGHFSGQENVANDPQTGDSHT